MAIRKNYIDKKVMYDELVDWINKNKERALLELPTLKQPNSLGIFFTQMAKKMGTRPNFSRYTYLDEMIQDGIHDCVKAVKSFDPAQVKKNPFGYFSIIIWNAFLRRIDIEKTAHQAKLDSVFDPGSAAFSTLDGQEFELNKDDLSDFYYEGKL